MVPEKGKYYTIKIKGEKGWTKLLEGAISIGGWTFTHLNYNGTKNTIYISTSKDTRIYHQGTLERIH